MSLSSITNGLKMPAAGSQRKFRQNLGSTLKICSGVACRNVLRPSLLARKAAELMELIGVYSYSSSSSFEGLDVPVLSSASSSSLEAISAYICIPRIPRSYPILKHRLLMLRGINPEIRHRAEIYAIEAGNQPYDVGASMSDCVPG